MLDKRKSTGLHGLYDRCQINMATKSVLKDIKLLLQQTSRPKETRRHVKQSCLYFMCTGSVPMS